MAELDIDGFHWVPEGEGVRKEVEEAEGVGALERLGKGEGNEPKGELVKMKGVGVGVDVSRMTVIVGLAEDEAVSIVDTLGVTGCVVRGLAEVEDEREGEWLEDKDPPD